MRGNESSPHRRLFLYVCNAPNPCGIRPPRRTAAPRPSSARHPGDMNVAPTATKRIRRGKRRGATCDARCRHGTTKSVREWKTRGIRPPRQIPPVIRATFMSPLRRRNVGAPLVTPGAGTAQRNAREWNSVRKWEPRHPPANGKSRHPPAPANPARHPGDMNVAPTWAKRRGAICDARCRHGTTEFRRKRNPSANGIPPQMGTAAFARPSKSRPSSGRHECRPYGGGLWKTWGRHL